MSEKFTVVAPPVTLSELAQIIEAGQTGGMDAAIKKSVELAADANKIRQTLREQRKRRGVKVRQSVLP